MGIFTQKTKTRRKKKNGNNVDLLDKKYYTSSSVDNLLPQFSHFNAKIDSFDYRCNNNINNNNNNNDDTSNINNNNDKIVLSEKEQQQEKQLLEKGGENFTKIKCEPLSNRSKSFNYLTGKYVDSCEKSFTAHLLEKKIIKNDFVINQEHAAHLKESSYEKAYNEKTGPSPLGTSERGETDILKRPILPGENEKKKNEGIALLQKLAKKDGSIQRLPLPPLTKYDKSPMVTFINGSLPTEKKVDDNKVYIFLNQGDKEILEIPLAPKQHSRRLANNGKKICPNTDNLTDRMNDGIFIAFFLDTDESNLVQGDDQKQMMKESHEEILQNFLTNNSSKIKSQGKQQNKYKVKFHYGNLGLQLIDDNGTNSVQVEKVIKDSQADRAGIIRQGHILHSIDEIEIFSINDVECIWGDMKVQSKAKYLTFIENVESMDDNSKQQKQIYSKKLANLFGVWNSAVEKTESDSDSNSTSSGNCNDNKNNVNINNNVKTNDNEDQLNENNDKNDNNNNNTNEKIVKNKEQDVNEKGEEDYGNVFDDTLLATRNCSDDKRYMLRYKTLPKIAGHSYRSHDDEYPMILNFSNQSLHFYITIYWIDYNGILKVRNIVKPGESYMERSYASHPWLCCAQEILDIDNSGLPIKGLHKTSTLVMLGKDAIKGSTKTYNMNVNIQKNSISFFPSTRTSAGNLKSSYSKEQIDSVESQQLKINLQKAEVIQMLRDTRIDPTYIKDKENYFESKSLGVGLPHMIISFLESEGIEMPRTKSSRKSYKPVNKIKPIKQQKKVKYASAYNKLFKELEEIREQEKDKKYKN